MNSVSQKWQIEELCSNGTDRWVIIGQATRVGKEEVFGLGWVSLHNPDLPILTVTFTQASAVSWLRTLYSAFVALESQDDYLCQIGHQLAVNAGDHKPKTAIVGTARGAGSIQIIVSWKQIAEAIVVVRSVEGPEEHIPFAIDNIAHLAQLTEEGFKLLGWDIPE